MQRCFLMSWVLLLLPHLLRLKFLFPFPPLYCKPEPCGGEPHTLLIFVSAFLLPLRSPYACTYHSVESAPNALSPYKAKCLTADILQICGFFFPPVHSDGLRHFFCACNDLVVWKYSTYNEEESRPLNIASSHKQAVLILHLSKYGWMMKHDSPPATTHISSSRWITRCSVKDRERASEGFVYARHCECGISKTEGAAKTGRWEGCEREGE